MSSQIDELKEAVQQTCTQLDACVDGLSSAKLDSLPKVCDVDVPDCVSTASMPETLALIYDTGDDGFVVLKQDSDTHS